MNFLEFERPIAELEAKIEELRHVGSDAEINISEEIERLQQKSVEMTEKIFNNLTAWQVVQIARHPLRPYSLDYISRIFTEFDELHGDRLFSDDRAIVAGFAILEGQAVMVIGQQKGRDTKEKVLRNFGMPQPEGYRKALRLMHLAEKFNLPIITLIDTPGAYPGVGAEARGQSEAIAKNLFEMSTLRVPVINLIIGEGCSGGALGIGVGDRTLMLEYAYYATISPEGCATILFKGAEHAAEAAEIMSITAKSHLANGIIDEIIPEPLGSAYRNFDEIANTVKESLVRNLRELQQLSITDLLKIRFDKLMSMGAHS
jgi:acetyl-CoA carboxylase carboxyl transferase subunit alpha